MEDLKQETLRSLVEKKIAKPDSVNDSEILKFVENMRTDWLDVRRKQKYDEQWAINAAFYAGDHYSRQRNRSQNSSYRVRLKENHINNIIQRIVSIVMQNMPITKVFPASEDWTDRKNAEYTEDYAKYFWRKKKIEQLVSRWIKSACIFGNSFIHGSWNPDIGDRVDLTPEETGDGKTKQSNWSGDIDLEVDQPMSFIPRPAYEEFDRLPDYIRSKPASRADLESKYGPLKSDGVKFIGGANYYRVENDMVMKNEYFHKPSSWWEEGCYICWVGDKILKISHYPYEKFGKLPAIMLGFDKIPGKFFAMAPMDQLIDLQEQLNKAASMIIEARNLIARPRWLVSNQSEVAAQNLTDRPGDVIKFNMIGGAPTPIVPSFNFNELAANKADLRNAIGQVSGITSASRGEIPTATRTALALQLVLEQDRSQFLPFIKDMNQGVIDLMYMILGITAQFIDEDDARVIKIEGQHRPRLFHGGMVPSPLDIYLEDTNPLGWTAGGRVEAVMELVGKGLITDRNQALEMIKLPSTDPAYRIQDINKDAAEKENDVLMQGELLEPLNEDDDLLHLDIHLRIASSFDYRSYPKQVKDAITYHINLHKQRLQQFGGAPLPEGENSPPSGGGNPNDSPIVAQNQPNQPDVESLLQK